MYQIAQLKGKKALVTERESLKGLKLAGNVTWIHITTKAEKDLDEIKGVFGFHQLAVEDSVSMRQRSKVEAFDDYILVLMKDPDFKNIVVVNQIALFIGRNYLVTVSNRQLAEVEAVFNRIKKNGTTKSWTPDFIAYRILDRIVDSYFPILEGIEDQVEAVEKEIISNPKKTIIQKLFKIRRGLLSLRKSMWPSRDVFSSLAKDELSHVAKKNRVYFRDVYDHVVVIIDLIETYRELVSGVLETYLSSISNSMNEVMKVLTVIATIFIPLTFITGLYGMNFQGGGMNMPELYWEFGYLAVLVMMLILGLGMVWYFKRKGWV